MTTHNILNADEAVNEVINSISDIPDDTFVVYEVWALGCNNENNVIENTEFLLSIFDDSSSAVEYAKSTTLADIVHISENCECLVDSSEISYLIVEVETVIRDEAGDMNIGTIFRKVVELPVF